MREIKLRGKRVDNGDWVYGNLYVKKKYVLILNEKKSGGKVDPKTVGQFVGLKDKNGVEIYEGDICKFLTKLNQHKIGFVQYYEKEARFRIVVPWPSDDEIDLGLNCDGSFYGLQQVFDLEVIGNIHETNGA